MTKGPKKVLVIEDEKPLRVALVGRLQSEGYEVSGTGDGSSGLAMAQEEQPDLIVLDLLMPSMDGMEVLKELRSTNDWGKKVPVIVLTNLTPNSDHLVHDVFETGPAYYLIKADTSLALLMEKVHAVLD